MVAVSHVINVRLLDPLRALVADVNSFLATRDVDAYATGGFVRDVIAGRPVRDLDVSVSGDPLAIGPGLADAFGGTYFPLDEERRHVRILLKDTRFQIDLLPLRGAIEEDLRMRDFTVDALGSPLAPLTKGRLDLIDPTGGLADLRARLVRAVSEENLLTDPLRLLRGARIATELGFEVEPVTAALIAKHAPLCASAAAERQRDAIMRICGTDRAAAGFRLLDSLGLLSAVLPEAEVMRDVEQPKEHYFDVLGHAFAAVESLDMLFSDQADDPHDLRRKLWGTMLTFWPAAREYFEDEVIYGTTRLGLLKFTAFLHDVGKPDTKTFEENGRMRFFGHSEAGAEIVTRLMRRLRFSASEIRMVKAMIDAHLRPVQLAQQGPPTRRAVYKFFRDTGDAGIDTLFLSLADHLGTVGPRVSADGWRAHVRAMAYIIAKRFGNEGIVSPPKLIAGEDLMAEFGLPPGPLLGELLEHVREAVAAGEVSTREEALAAARERLKQTSLDSRY